MTSLRVALFLIFALLSAAPAATLRDQLALAQKDSDRLSQIELIRRILEQEPKDAVLHEQLADLWIQIEDYDMAEKTVKEWKDAPEFVTASIMADVLYHRDQKKTEAVKLLTDYLAKEPTDAVITRQLLGYLVALQENQQIVDLLKSRKEDAVDTDLFVARALAQRNLNNYEAALADFALAKKLDEDFSEVSSNTAVFDRLQAAAPGLRSSAALLKTDPQHFGGLLTQTYWYLFAGFGAEPAFRNAEAAYKLHPESAAAALLYAKSGYALNKISYLKAREDLLVDATGPLPDISSVQRLVQADYLLSQNPKDLAALTARGYELNDSPAQYRLSQRDSTLGIEIDPKNPVPRLERIYSLVKLTEPAAAEAEFRALDALKPAPDQLAIAASYLIDSSFAASKFDAALEYANRAIKLNPKAAQYYKQRAAVFQKLNRAPEAEADLAKARTLEKKVSR